ncbi:flagellar basal body rod protein FlgF [Meridianimarinicoccus sp. RP-17]
MIHTALNALAVRRDAKTTQAQNLANMNVPGFRRDLENDGGTMFLEQMRAASSRAFRMETGPAGFSAKAGFLNPTGEDLDVAIADQGYFFIRPENGDPALSRRGDLRIDADGVLRNGAGDVMLGIDQEQIVVPAHRSVTINELGEIRIAPQGGEPGEVVLVGTLATAAPPVTDLAKGLDGHIRPKDGPLPAPDQQARVLQGTLEGSNVNPVEELIASIDLQRSFELGVRMISTAREIDEAGASLMRAPE